MTINMKSLKRSINMVLQENVYSFGNAVDRRAVCTIKSNL